MLPSLLFYAAMLAVTVVVECALVWLAGRGRADRAVVVRTALFLNLCTHPLATLVGSQSGAFLQLEMLVALAEGVGYRYVAGQSWPRALGLTFIANVATAVLGIVSAGLLAGW